jgi:RNA polymerase sigma-32 factor
MLFDRQNAQLAEEAFKATRSEKDRNKMIMHHTGLVHMILKKYSFFIEKNKYQDLFQEGMIGLMTAARKFNPAKEVKFTTYAGWWVKAYIQNYITDERANTYNTIKKLAFDRNPNKKIPDEDERRARLNFSIKLNDTVSTTEMTLLTYQDVIADTSVDIEADRIKTELKEMLYTVSQPFLVTKLRELIFHERLMSNNPKTLQEIGNTVGLSREGVRLHEKALLQEIKRAVENYLQGQP